MQQIFNVSVEKRMSRASNDINRILRITALESWLTAVGTV